jgi:N-acetylglucosamine-6-phosphate deacetylase
MQTKLMFGDTKSTEELDKILKANPTLGTAHFLAALKSLYEKKNEQSLNLLRDAMRFAPEEPDFLELFNEVSQSKVASGQK